MWKCKYCGGTVGAKTSQIEELDKKENLQGMV